MSSSNAPQTPLEKDEEGVGATPETQYAATPEAADEYPLPIPYDDEVPVYWDMALECYYYYGYQIVYDDEQQSYYYWSHEEGDYLYIDQETLDLINANQIYSYNNETGEYELTPAEEEAAGEGEVVADEEGEEEEEGVLEQVDPSEVPTPTTTTPPTTTTEAAALPLPSEGLYGMNEADPFDDSSTRGGGGGGGQEMSPSMQAMLKHVMAMSAPQSSGGEKFPNSIDFFNDSYQNISNRGHKLLFEMCGEDKTILEEYKQRPNGTYVIGRCKRTVDGLIRGNLELKSLAATEVSSVASVLQDLSLPQLAHIRWNAQNSAWLKAPQPALKSFAEKCDNSIGEKLVHFMLARGVESEAVEARNKRLLKKLGPANTRQCGIWAGFCLGALSELTAAKDRVLGEDGAKAHWWWLTAGTATGSTMLRGECDEADVRGVFMRVQNTGTLDLRAQFDCPAKAETPAINRLIAGRGESYVRWDVTEVALF